MEMVRIDMEKWKKIAREIFPKEFEEFNNISGRKPEVVFKDSIEDDVRRRDLTINSMFYDLDDPNKFLEDIKECLDRDGIFIIHSRPGQYLNRSFVLPMVIRFGFYILVP